MVKVSIILSFLTILFGCIWAARVCNSCGSECAPACGTRYFRSCCFNYLRKKRGPDYVKFLKPNHDWKADSLQWSMPLVVSTNTFWRDNDLKIDQQDGTAESILQALYKYDDRTY